MARLVALALPAGPAFVEALVAAWEAGDAVAPVDLRLPPPARRRLLAALRPDRLVEAGSTTRLEGAVGTEEGDALVVATSGTTGTPKGVVLTHEAVAASARATSERLAVDPAADGWLCCLPLGHVGGLSVVTRALSTGTRLEVQPGFDAGEARRAATERGATLVSLVPTALGRLGEEAAALFRVIVLGGQAPPARLWANCVTTYGLTETGSGVVYDGRPLTGVEVRVVEGEVQLRGPMLLRCYRDGTDPKTADGWLATGDAGELAPDGRLVVHGRLDDVVISGGENVWPAEVERVVRQSPHLAEVAVAGRPDDEWGARVVAYVVVREPSAAPSADALLEQVRELVKEVLPAYCAPRELVVVDALPLGALGKVRRGELAALVGPSATVS